MAVCMNAYRCACMRICRYTHVTLIKKIAWLYRWVHGSVYECICVCMHANLQICSCHTWSVWLFRSLGAAFCTLPCALLWRAWFVCVCKLWFLSEKDTVHTLILWIICLLVFFMSDEVWVLSFVCCRYVCYTCWAGLCDWRGFHEGCAQGVWQQETGIQTGLQTPLNNKKLGYHCRIHTHIYTTEFKLDLSGCETAIQTGLQAPLNKKKLGYYQCRIHTHINTTEFKLDLSRCETGIQTGQANNSGTLCIPRVCLIQIPGEFLWLQNQTSCHSDWLQLKSKRLFLPAQDRFS